MACAEERRLKLSLEREAGSAVCVLPSGTPPPRSVRLTSTGRGNQNHINGGPINQCN